MWRPALARARWAREQTVRRQRRRSAMSARARAPGLRGVQKRPADPGDAGRVQRGRDAALRPAAGRGRAQRHPAHPLALQLVGRAGRGAPRSLAPRPAGARGRPCCWHAGRALHAMGPGRAGDVCTPWRLAWLLPPWLFCFILSAMQVHDGSVALSLPAPRRPVRMRRQCSGERTIMDPLCSRS